MRKSFIADSAGKKMKNGTCEFKKTINYCANDVFKATVTMNKLHCFQIVIIIGTKYDFSKIFTFHEIAVKNTL